MLDLRHRKGFLRLSAREALTENMIQIERVPTPLFLPEPQIHDA
jgi:hypothetical protein